MIISFIMGRAVMEAELSYSRDCGVRHVSVGSLGFRSKKQDKELTSSWCICRVVFECHLVD